MHCLSEFYIATSKLDKTHQHTKNMSGTYNLVISSYFNYRKWKLEQLLNKKFHFLNKKMSKFQVEKGNWCHLCVCVLFFMLTKRTSSCNWWSVSNLRLWEKPNYNRRRETMFSFVIKTVFNFCDWENGRKL